MVNNHLKMPIFVQSVQKLHSYTALRQMCRWVHFSHASRVLQLNLPHHDSFGLGVSAVAMVTNPPKSFKKILLLRRYAPSNILCALLICLKRFTRKFATPS